MRILVTGGAGFIGSVLVEELIGSGHSVTVLDDMRYGQTGVGPNALIILGDARNQAILRDLVPDHDAFIPLAAIVGAPACDKAPKDAATINLGAVETLLDMLSNDQIVLYPNTNSGYGIGGEDACDESSPLRPISLYGRTKCAAEKAVLERANSVVFRLATVFGTSPRMRTDLMVNDFVNVAFTTGAITLYQAKARRNFVHVRDVAGAFVHAIENFESMRGKAYNCGDTRANMTKGELCDAIARQIAFSWNEGPGEDPDRRDYLVLNDRLEATGWAPQRSLDDGIAELLAYYRNVDSRRHGNI
jgi:nucleoside-diphosphate-sugar epimerase